MKDDGVRRPRAFLVERYLPGVTAGEARSIAQRADRAARESREKETEIRLVWSLFLPGDEAVLCLFEGPSLAAVEAANRRAGVPFDRIAHGVRFREPARTRREEAVQREGDVG
jgi:Protein of unknown function (DUF4242)